MASTAAGSSSAATDDAARPAKSLEWRDLDKRKFFFYNPLIFYCIRVVQHPFNVVKTRFQLQKAHSLYASTSMVWSTIMRREGVRGFYRGFGTSSLQLIVQQCYYVTYEALRDSKNYSPSVSESVRNSLSAALAVFLSQIIANPIDVIASRLMMQGQLSSNIPMPPRQVSTATAVAPVAEGAAGATSRAAATQTVVQPTSTLGPMDVLRSIIAQKGIRGLWSGFFISCAQFIPSGSLWWGVYPQYRLRLIGPLQAARERVLAYLERSEARYMRSASGPGPPLMGTAANAIDSTRADSVSVAGDDDRPAAPPPAVDTTAAMADSSNGDERASSSSEGIAIRKVSLSPPGLDSPLSTSTLGKVTLRLPHDDAFHSVTLTSGDGMNWINMVPRPARLAEVLAGGASSGTVAVVMNPLDIVRTRTQVEGLPAMTILRQLLAQEGFKGLWKGTTARMVMLIPQGMMSSTAYEFVKRLSAKEQQLHVAVEDTSVR